MDIPVYLPVFISYPINEFHLGELFGNLLLEIMPYPKWVDCPLVADTLLDITYPSIGVMFNDFPRVISQEPRDIIGQRESEYSLILIK